MNILMSTAFGFPIVMAFMYSIADAQYSFHTLKSLVELNAEEIVNSGSNYPLSSSSRRKRAIDLAEIDELFNLTLINEQAEAKFLNSMNQTQRMDLVETILKDDFESVDQLSSDIETWTTNQGGAVLAAYENYKQILKKLFAKILDIHYEIAANLSSEAKAADNEILRVISNTSLNAREQCEALQQALSNVSAEVIDELFDAFGPVPCIYYPRQPVGETRERHKFYGNRGFNGRRGGRASNVRRFDVSQIRKVHDKPRGQVVDVSDRELNDAHTNTDHHSPFRRF